MISRLSRHGIKPERQERIMVFVVPAAQNQLLIILKYDATGMEWVDLFDNVLVGWVVDDSGSQSSGPAPQSFEPAPRAIGSLPPLAPDTAPVISPQWAVMMPEVVFVPNLYRG